MQKKLMAVLFIREFGAFSTKKGKTFLYILKVVNEIPKKHVIGFPRESDMNSLIIMMKEASECRKSYPKDTVYL
jgi:hypothetical protein